MLLRKIFGAKKEEVKEAGEKLSNGDFITRICRKIQLG
jgi:hypothetical protein